VFYDLFHTSSNLILNFLTRQCPATVVYVRNSKYFLTSLEGERSKYLFMCIGQIVKITICVCDEVHTFETACKSTKAKSFNNWKQTNCRIVDLFFWVYWAGNENNVTFKKTFICRISFYVYFNKLQIVYRIHFYLKWNDKISPKISSSIFSTFPYYCQILFSQFQKYFVLNIKIFLNNVFFNKSPCTQKMIKQECLSETSI